MNFTPFYLSLLDDLCFKRYWMVFFLFASLWNTVEGFYKNYGSESKGRIASRNILPADS